MPLSEGNYFCHIKNQGLKKTSKGQQFIVFNFEVVAQLLSDGSRRSRTPGLPEISGELIFWLTDKAFDNSLRDVSKIVGGEISSFAQLDPRHPRCLSALGKELELTCKQEEYLGRMQTKWSLPRDMGKPLSTSEVETLDERLKARRQAASAPADLPPDMPAGMDLADAISDEDLPF